MAVWRNAVIDSAEQFERKREALLKEAAAAFNRSGYHGTSLTEIAQKLGVTKAALYTYVASKEDLLYYCHDSAMDSAMACLQQTDMEGGSGLDKLTRALDLYIQMMLTEGDGYIILLEEHAMKPAHARAIVKRRDLFERGLRAFVDEGVKDGSIVACDSKMVVFTALGAMNWSRKWYSAGGKWGPAQVAFAMTELLKRSIAAHPSRRLAQDVSAIAVTEKRKPIRATRTHKRAAA